MEIAQEEKAEILGQLPPEELAQIRKRHAEFAQMKTVLGELEVQKHSVLKAVDELQYESKVHEQKIVKRYGEKVIINTKTGELTRGN